MSIFMNKSYLLRPLIIRINKIHSNAALVDNCTNINNRNPRNLELLRIARKPSGYHLDKPGREFWHRLVIKRLPKYITFEVEHFVNGAVVSASSNEWAIKKYLYKLQDAAAYINIGRILGQRCLESGIIFVQNNYKSNNSEKIDLALTELSNAGVILTEPTRYINPQPWDRYRPEKPWNIQE